MSQILIPTTIQAIKATTGLSDDDLKLETNVWRDICQAYHYAEFKFKGVASLTYHAGLAVSVLKAITFATYKQFGRDAKVFLSLDASAIYIWIGFCPDQYFPYRGKGMSATAIIEDMIPCLRPGSPFSSAIHCTVRVCVSEEFCPTLMAVTMENITGGENLAFSVTLPSGRAEPSAKPDPVSSTV
jgi:hypothetical protein